MTPLQRLLASGRVVRAPTARLEDLGPPLPASRRVIAALHAALEDERAERVASGAGLTVASPGA